MNDITPVDIEDLIGNLGNTLYDTLRVWGSCNNDQNIKDVLPDIRNAISKLQRVLDTSECNYRSTYVRTVLKHVHDEDSPTGYYDCVSLQTSDPNVYFSLACRQSVFNENYEVVSKKDIGKEVFLRVHRLIDKEYYGDGDLRREIEYFSMQYINTTCVPSELLVFDIFK